MLLLPLVFVLLSWTGVHGSEQNVITPVLDWENYELRGRIVNGTKAVSKQFPYQVSLRRSYNSKHFCGGTLIDEYYILTAAHCMYMDGGRLLPWTITVVAGELKLNKETSTGQKRGVDAIYVHSGFDESTLQNDIALLALKKPFLLTEEVMVAPLTTQPLIPDTVCQVAGWGYPSVDYPVVSNDLMYIDLPILSRAQCKQLLVNVTNLPPGMFCAGYIEGQRDACQGDSGGGMVCNGQLTGIVSGGEGCAFPRLPGVYSSVFYFEDWILKNMNVTSYAQNVSDVRVYQLRRGNEPITRSPRK
ncbi:trypsin-2 isoform X2 [Ptiloglossa arizonensis]|uniref:trypsin-2 isoform X2 n=1 Tax=Ptiloglossa arizonensis TaxID=3350558 RepID=UPI003F9F7E75